MPDLTPDETQHFQAALLSAFPSPAAFEQLTFFSTGSHLKSVVNTAVPLGEMLFALSAWLDANDKVAPFLRQARKQNPGNPLLREFERAYDAARAPAVPTTPVLSPRLRDDLVTALAAVPALHGRDERDRLLGDASTPALRRNEHDARGDLELLVDQLPAATLAALADRAAQAVAAYNPSLAQRLTDLAASLRRDFREPTPAEPMSASPPSNPEALLFEGVDERKPRAFLLRAADIGRGVAPLAVPRYFQGAADGRRGYGTGWLIGPRLVLTNHHVVDARDRRYEAAAAPDDFARQGAAVEAWFDYFEKDAAVRKATSTEVVAADEKLDFALLRLDQVPDAAERPPLRLLLQRPALRASDRLNIVQHAAGDPQTYALRNNFFVGSDATHLRYLTDTEQGASGSPVLNDDWRVVGLHRAAQPIAPRTVTALDLAGSRVVRFFNEGVYLDAILAWLKARAPEAHAEILAANLT